MQNQTLNRIFSRFVLLLLILSFFPSINLVQEIKVAHAATPAYVQSGYGECYPATTCTVDFGVPGVPGVNVTAGNLLVLTYRSDNSSSNEVLSVTSQPGSRAWTRDRRQLSATNFWLEVWSLPNAPGGDTDVTVTVGSPADAMRIVLTEYSGLATSNHVDVAVSNANSQTASCVNAGTITTTIPNALIHSAVGANGNDQANETWTAGSGYTRHDLGDDNPAGSDKTFTQHRVAATVGGYNTEVCNIGDWTSAIAVAYKAADSTPSNSTLTVSKAGTGSGTVTGTGINCGSDCSETVVSGTSISLSASPASGSSFSGWSGGGCSGIGSCNVTVNNDITVTVTFDTSSATPILGDINLDGIVNSIDYSILNSDWFTSNSRSDFNNDGIVNAIDFSMMNANWLRTW